MNSIEKELQCIVGQPLTDMWRYAGFQKFEFGPQVSGLNRQGEKISSGNIGLIIACKWTIVSESGGGISSSDFDHKGNDIGEEPIRFLDILLTNPCVAIGLRVASGGLIEIQLTNGYQMRIIPMHSNDEEDDEQWRLMVNDRPDRHFVFRHGVSYE